MVRCGKRYSPRGINWMNLQTARAPSLRLLGDSAPASLRTFDLDRDVTVLGRDPGCHIILMPATVSRRHARVLRRHEGCYLEDLGSAGGTLLNEKPLTGPVRLRDGDRIGIGDCTFSFSDPASPEESKAGGAAILGIREVSGSAERALAGVQPEGKLRAMLEISSDLVGTYELSAVLERTLDALFRIFPQAERGFVLLKKEGPGATSPRAIKVRGGMGSVAVSRTVLEHVVRHGQAILSEDASIDSRFGGSRSVDDAEIRTLMCAPLKDHLRRTVGILQLDTKDRLARFTREDLNILAAVAGQVSVAVDNARLLDAAARERQRLALLAEAGATLTAPLDPQALLAALARLIVPHLGDLCLIDLRDDDGTIRRVAVAHSDPAKQMLADEQLRRFPPDPTGSHPAMRVMRSGRPELSNDVTEQFLRDSSRNDEHYDVLRHLGLLCYMVVPFVARGQVLGTLTLAGTETNRSYGPPDLALAEELARRAAQALDNAALYQSAEAARRQAEEASRSKDLFLAMLSHELRTPLTPILMAVSARLPTTTDKELRADLEMIRRNIALEARLIDDLLDLSRIEKGRLRLDRDVVDVHKTIRQAVEICRDETKLAGLTVKLDLGASAYHVDGDGARLIQIAWNLIRNAAKFTPAGGSLTIRTKNVPLEPADADRQQLIIEFQDTGRGIEPDLLARIFEAFEQGQGEGGSRSAGLGLGLAISRSLAEAHGGSLTVESAGVGQGATFRLELTTTPAPKPVQVAAAPPEPPVPSQNLKVLLVEDNRDALRYLALVLNQRGYQVTTAPSLSEGLSHAATDRFDVLVSDLELPDGSGLELMKELAQKGIPGVAMSGYGSDEDLRQSLDSGFSAHLTKPVDARRLEETILNVVRQATAKGHAG